MPEQIDWKSRALAAEARVRELEPLADLAREIGQARAKHRELFAVHKQVLTTDGDWVRSGAASADAEREMMALLDQAAASGKVGE